MVCSCDGDPGIAPVIAQGRVAVTSIIWAPLRSSAVISRSRKSADHHCHKHRQLTAAPFQSLTDLESKQVTISALQGSYRCEQQHDS